MIMMFVYKQEEINDADPDCTLVPHAWFQITARDTEYIAAFQHVVMPIAYEVGSCPWSELCHWDQEPVPLSIFRSNSMKIQNALVSNILDRSQRYFTHVTTVTLSWRVQNIVAIGRVYFTLECFEFSLNFEFDRNMLSGTGAWSPFTNMV